MSEPTSTNPHIATWLSHIRALAVDIGSRGSTREGEKSAALYAMAQFEKMGLQPIFETFISARSIFHPHLLGSSPDAVSFYHLPTGRQANCGIGCTVVCRCAGLRVIGAWLPG